MEKATLLKAKDLAARHLGRRARSERELKTYLERKGFGVSVIGEVLRDFRRVGLLDDHRMSRDWVERRLDATPSGRRAMEQRLRFRGVEDNTIAEVLEEVFAAVSERELCLRAAARKRDQLKHLDPDVRRQRLYRFLVQRGFPPDLVSEFVEETDHDL